LGWGDVVLSLVILHHALSNPLKPLKGLVISPIFTPSLQRVKLEAVLNGSILSIEFLLNQNHGQIGSMCLEKRSDCAGNVLAVGAMCASPAQTMPPLFDDGISRFDGYLLLQAS
jgi:hypothetical protein